MTPATTRTRALRQRLRTRRVAAAAAATVVLMVAAFVVPSWLDNGAYSLQRFHSRPDLRPPQVDVTRGPAVGAGRYIFVAPKNGPGPAGPMILDTHGHVVWFKHLPKGIQAFDFKPGHWHGRPVMTWWQGHSAKGNGAGVDVIADSSYREIARVPMRRGYRADLHDFTLTGHGTARVLVYRPVPYDLRPVGGPRHGHAVDGIVEEINVKTGRVVYEWHSLQHIPITDSYKKMSETKGDGYDYFHINSVREVPGGKLLISARHTNAVYEISKRTGAVLWRLGGKHSSFRMGHGTRFVAQHDARLGPGRNTISLFDNEAPPDKNRQSRVVLIRIDRRAHRATLVHQYKHPAGVQSDSQGSAEFLPNGHVFIGWGGKSPRFSEYTNGGRMVFDAKFLGNNTNSYRSYLMPWHGTPRRRPAIAVERRRHRTYVYASWNGSTELARWELLGGRRPSSLHRVALRPRHGFETRFVLRHAPRFLVVRALDRRGDPLRRSRLTRGLR